MKRRAVGPAAALLAAGLVPSPPPAAFPEGAPWDVAGEQGCTQCHFDAPAVDGSKALAIEGLPAEVTPGGRYTLTIRLESEMLRMAGFLLSAQLNQGDTQAGTFFAADERVETRGAQARSTEAGLRHDTPGTAEWDVEWQAPQALDSPLVLELWANAGNDDQSPFGDRTHRRVIRIAP